MTFAAMMLASWLLAAVNPSREHQMSAHAQITYGEGSITSLMSNFKDNVPIHWPTGVLYGLPSKNSILTTNNPLGNDRG